MTRQVPRWLRRILGILTLGGGAAGLATVVASFIAADGLVGQIICAAFALLYGTGMICGMLLIEGSDRVTRWCYLYWQLQMPVVVTGWYGYEFTSALSLVAWVRPYEGNLGFTYFIGSQWFLTLLRTVGPTSWGINLFALALVLVFRRYLPRATKAVAQVPVAPPSPAGAAASAATPAVNAPVAPIAAAGVCQGQP